jgi:hypothetical protein
MRRRKFRWVLVALAGLAPVAIAAAFVLRPLPPSKINEASFALIPKGLHVSPTMDRAQVEAILGPPGDYRTVPTLGQAPSYWSNGTTNGFLTTLAWEGDTAIICVHFTPSGFVFGKDLISNQPKKLTYIEVLVWRAKRQWHRWFP